MSADIVALYDAEEASRLDALWRDFLEKRNAAFEVPTKASAASAGRAFGDLLQALAHADAMALRAFQNGVE